MSTTTVLRVKRPRNVAPVSALTFQGKKRARVDDIADLATALEESKVSSSSMPTTNTLFWKRKETALEPHLAVKFINKRSLKCVDAILEEPSSKKQRLLTLVPNTPTSELSSLSSWSSPSKRKGAAIINPAARLVKESLELVQSGTKTVQEHMNYIELDKRLSLDCKKWILVECNDGSNILHLCALWNDVESCRRLCMIYLSSKLMEHVDHSQQRPYQVAQLAKHTNVAQVLEAFGADTTDFVYDIYHLEQAPMEHDEIKQKDMLRVDLSGGVGYWNEHGELILEALCPEDFGDADSLKNDHDDDEDSNAEDAEANDYPEEEDASDDEEDCVYDDAYRHVPIYNMPDGTHMNNPTTAVIQDDDDEYDAQYGLYESSGDTSQHRIHAYDPSYDDDEEAQD